jgi:hypothetical protein
MSSKSQYHYHLKYELLSFFAHIYIPSGRIDKVLFEVTMGGKFVAQVK